MISESYSRRIPVRGIVFSSSCLPPFADRPRARATRIYASCRLPGLLVQCHGSNQLEECRYRLRTHTRNKGTRSSKDFASIRHVSPFASCGVSRSSLMLQNAQCRYIKTIDASSLHASPVSIALTRTRSNVQRVSFLRHNLQQIPNA
jgi:hypothetical protein